MAAPVQPTSRVSFIAFMLLLTGTAVLALTILWPYLLSLFLGGLLALLFHRPFLRLRRAGIGSRTASLLTTLAMLLLVIGPLSLFTSVAVRQAISVGQVIASRDDLFTVSSLASRVAKIGPVQQLIGSPEALETQLRSALRRGVGQVTELVVALARALPLIGLQLALACIACFFLLSDGRAFVSWIGSRIPLERDIKAKLNAVLRDMALSTIWATMAASAAQASVMVIAYLVLGVPAAALACGATLLFSWIPLVGATPIWGSGMFYLWTQGAMTKVVLMLAFGIVASLVDNFVRPLVLKGRGELHPLVALVSIFGGISAFGILGAFIGPLIASLLIALLQLWPEIGRREAIRVASDARGKPAA